MSCDARWFPMHVTTSPAPALFPSLHDRAWATPYVFEMISSAARRPLRRAPSIVA